MPVVIQPSPGGGSVTVSPAPAGGSVEVIPVEGIPGEGVATGGTTGQVLAKQSNADYDTYWTNAGAGGAWGGITGTLSAQTDLQTALDGKQAAGSYANAAHTHIIADVTGLQTALDGKQASGSYQPLATVLTNTTASFTTAQETKLSGIATAATANATDANLRDRATHTGEQAVSTVTGLQTALDGKQPLATVLTNTTASFTTAQETKLAGIATGATANTGTVTSVSGTGTVSGLTLTGSVTTSGDLTLGGTLAVTASNFASQTAATFLAAPNGSSGVPSFRAIIAADIPTLNQSTTGSAATLTTSRNFSISDGGITAAAVGFNGSAAVTLSASVDAGHITLARMANVATASVFYRKTAGTGAPEVQTLATLKTDLGLTGTNSGDQTITLTGDVTGSGAGSFVATIGANKVTNAQLAQVATATFKGRTTASTGNVEDLTATQATALLNVATVSLKGLMSAADKTKLDGIATGATANTGDVVGPASATDNAIARFDGTTGKLVQNSGIAADDNGNLLVGATATINAAKMVVQFSSANNGLYLDETSSTSGTQYMRFSQSGTTAGSITRVGTTSAVAYNTTSDARAKHDIIDAPEASSLIDAIQVRSFKWNADKSHQRYGFIAQELLKVAPEAVSQPADPDGMMGVDYSKLVPMLVKEIQSLRQTVKRLCAEVDEIKATPQ